MQPRRAGVTIGRGEGWLFHRNIVLGQGGANSQRQVTPNPRPILRLVGPDPQLEVHGVAGKTAEQSQGRRVLHNPGCVTAAPSSNSMTRCASAGAATETGKSIRRRRSEKVQLVTVSEIKLPLGTMTSEPLGTRKMLARMPMRLTTPSLPAN